ncbi:MAG: phage tail length tape measure family protein [Novosphingobium sp.]
MALRASLVLSGDASSANAALDAVDKNMAGAEAEAAKLAAAYGQVDRAISQLGRAQATAATETARAKAEFAAGTISVEQYNARLLETKTALGLMTGQHAAAVGALKQTQAAIGGATVSVGQAKAGYINLGRQMQDVAVQAQMGSNIGTIIAMQGGQVADAVAQMGGRFSGLAGFLAGPWGAAIIVGVGMLANLAESLLTTGDDAEAAKSKTYDFSQGLDVLTLSANQTSDAMRQLQQEMRNAIAVQGDFLRSKALIASQSVASIQTRIDTNSAELGGLKRQGESWSSLVPFNQPDFARMGELRKQLAADREALQLAQGALVESNMAVSQSRVLEKLDKRTSILGNYNREVAALGVKYRSDQANPDALAQRMSQSDYERQFTSLTAGKNAAIEALSPASTGRRGRNVGTGGAQIAAFSDSAGSKIAKIRDQFTDMPAQVLKTNDAMRQLNDILSDIGRKKGLKPEAAAELRKEIEATKGTIEESLNKPFNDYLEKTREAGEVDRLRLAGRQDEADALEIVIGLEKQQKPLSAEQLDKVLEMVKARREEAKVLRDQQAIIQAQVQGVTGLRSALEQSFAGLFKGKFSLDAVFQQIASTYIEVASKRAVEALFGNALRALEDKAAGLTPVQRAGKDMATAMDKGSGAVKTFADAVADATAVIQGKPVTPRATGAANDNAPAANDNGDIVVNGRKPVSIIDKLVGSMATAADLAEAMTRAVTDPLAAVLDDLLGVRFFTQLSGALAGAVAGYMTAGPAGGLIGLLKNVKGMPEAIDKAFGKGGVLDDALKGAQTGTVIAGLGKAIGINMSSTGAQIGGAIGSIIPGVGSIIGSIAGGLLGGLFSKRPRGSGSVTQDSITASANDAGIKDSLNSFGASVQTAVSRIADALGGTVGSYSIGLGRYKDYYQVSSSATDKYLGQTYYDKKSSDALYDGKDATAALQAAIAGAIADGAVKGISAKVAAALKSDTNIDKAIAEAIKVDDLEVLLGGVTGALTKEFRTFQSTADERVRLAKKYGFDMLAVDKLNADERLKLQEKLLGQQVGSLKQLIEDMTSGSLFEGTSIDRRQALLDQIATVKGQADQGVDGAADKLASLLQDFNQVSKEAFGTTGAFAADRGTILDVARDTIAQSNQRVADAQAAAASDPGVAAALNENNDQNAQALALSAQSIELLKANNALLAQSLGGYPWSSGLAALAAL